MFHFTISIKIDGAFINSNNLYNEKPIGRFRMNKAHAVISLHGIYIHMYATA